MTTACVRLERNTLGRDLVIGDLHGMVSLLEAELERIGFDPSADRLICVGDLVDRGSESHRVPELLREPWFYSVLGNHDVLYLLRTEHFPTDDSHPREWLIGGDFRWWTALSPEARTALQAALGSLPWLIEIDTEVGLVGVVHAEVPQQFDSWAELRALVEHCVAQKRFDALHPLVWGRQLHSLARIRDESGTSPEAWRDLAEGYRLSDVAHVIHGHNVDPNVRVRTLANRHYIDTGAYLTQPVYLERWPLKNHPRLTIVDARAPDVPL